MSAVKQKEDDAKTDHLELLLNGCKDGDEVLEDGDGDKKGKPLGMESSVVMKRESDMGRSMVVSLMSLDTPR